MAGNGIYNHGFVSITRNKSFKLHASFLEGPKNKHRQEKKKQRGQNQWLKFPGADP